jgi:hypothetical protein
MPSSPPQVSAATLAADRACVATKSAGHELTFKRTTQAIGPLRSTLVQASVKEIRLCRGTHSCLYPFVNEQFYWIWRFCVGLREACGAVRHSGDIMIMRYPYLIMAIILLKSSVAKGLGT